MPLGWARALPSPENCIGGFEMTVTHSPAEMVRQAKQIATDHGCFVSERDGRYRVFRKTGTNPAWCGSAVKPAALLSLVKRITNFR